MKKIVIGTTEIEVKSLTPVAYTQARGEKEKVLQIEVDANVATFEQLRTALENAEDPVQYKEDDALICEYVGYGTFSVTYKNGVYSVEMHKKSLVGQMTDLLVANEKLTQANATLTKVVKDLTAQNEALMAQNALHDATLAEVLEVILPATLDEIMRMVMSHEERLLLIETPEETETEAAAESGTVAE